MQPRIHGLHLTGRRRLAQLRLVSSTFIFLLATLSAWCNRQQQGVIAYLKAENAVLREQLGKRARFNDSQRRKLARAAKALGRKTLMQVPTLVTAHTLLRWHRQLIARKWTFPSQSPKSSPGRPRIDTQSEALVLRMARDNPGWGYRRIAGELHKLGHGLCHQSVGNLLRVHGFDPAPKRRGQLTWRQFLRRHKELVWGTDFFACEVWTKAGLTTFYVLFYLHQHSREVVLGGITRYPDEIWMLNRARALTWHIGALETPGILLHDRDGKYCKKWATMFEEVGWRVRKLPARSPNLNAYAERFVRSIKDECLEQLILVGERSLRRAVQEYVEHYHGERPHQGIGNTVPFPSGEEGGNTSDCGSGVQVATLADKKVLRSSRLGGLLHNYRLSA